MPRTETPLTRMTPRRWIEYTIAILAGNALYFFVLYPGMAPVLQHQPFRFDLGLVVDFLCCVAVYGAIRLGVAHARRWSNGGRGVRSASRRPQRRSAPDR